MIYEMDGENYPLSQILNNIWAFGQDQKNYP